MKLKLKHLEHFVVAISRNSNRRHHVTVFETRGGVLTGEKWGVTYDPAVVTDADLSVLIDSQISGAPAPVFETDRDAVTEALEVLGAVLAPMVSTCIHNTANAIKKRMEEMQAGKRVDPEQVIIEREYERVLDKLARKLTPVVAKLLHQAEETDAGSLESSNLLSRLFRRLPWLTKSRI